MVSTLIQISFQLSTLRVDKLVFDRLSGYLLPKILVFGGRLVAACACDVRLAQLLAKGNRVGISASQLVCQASYSPVQFVLMF